MEARTKLSRKLQTLKHSRDQQVPLLNCDVHADIKALEVKNSLLKIVRMVSPIHHARALRVSLIYTY